ncbi:COG1470 family protein [Nostoc sp.]|uniref:COG1470 family protein n=1 Tax=Nostoc sp. TaxID=1180 RepID=UPI002FF5E9FF
MLNLITPLKVILNPPTRLEGFPGESVTLHISLINQGEQGAAIDVFIDPIAQTLLSWCPSARKRVALDSQQACEVSLVFEIPLDALPGSYPYTVVVDAPEHYPEETPIHYPGSLEVLVKEHAVIRSQNLTFSISPATSPVQPLLVQPNQHQRLSVIVNNHSSRVDRFRLHCLDLDKTWFTIQYPSNELSELGVVSSTDGLELNPGGQGEIIIELHYPIDMPAGHYSPTLQLISDNAPEQVFLDLVYLEVKPKLHLSVELETILGKVSHSPGQYRLILTNHGNSIRELAVSATSRDETQLCDYVCSPSSVNLLIGETATISLTVYPKQKWRRPFFGYGLELPFQVNLQDLQALPTPENLPMGLLVWKARPWWQFLLWLLAGVGALSGLGFLIWFVFFKPVAPPILTEFKPDSTSYNEGGRVRLSWTISNSDRLDQLVVSSTKDQTANSPQVYDFRQGLPTELNRYCQIRDGETPAVGDRNLTCTNVDTGARLAGEYTFQLQIKAKSVQKPIEQKLNVVIQPKPLPQVMSIAARQSQLEKGKPLTLSWNIKNFSQLGQLQVIGQLKDGKPTLFKTYDFQKQIPPELTKQCQPPVNETLSCSNVDIGLPAKPGDYAISLQPVSNGSQKQSLPSKAIQVQLKATPLRVMNFTLNNQSSETNPSIFLKVGQFVTLNWQVHGDGVKVKLEPLGDVPASGSRTFKATTNLSQIILTAETEQGQSVKRAFLLQVDMPKPLPKPINTSSPTVIPFHFNTNRQQGSREQGIGGKS